MGWDNRPERATEYVKQTRLNIRCTLDEHAELARAAVGQGCSLSAYVIEAALRQSKKDGA